MHYRNFQIILLALFINLSYAMEITLVHGDGNTDKVDLVVIGDGYSLSDQDHYANRVDEIVDYMFGSSKMVPYPRYKNFINIWRIDLVSPDSGIDKIDAGIWKNTPLNGHDGCIDYTIQQCQVDWNITHDSIDVITGQKGFDPDWFLVLLNTDGATAAAHYSGRGVLPILGTQVTNWYSRQLDIVFHEAGHAWHRLADEYHYFEGNTFSGGEPSEVNVSLQSDGAKWSHWLGYQSPDMSVVAAYEGSKYAEFGIWDPTQGSKMDGGGVYNCHSMNNDCGHHAIAIEKIIQDIHSISPQVLASPTEGSSVQNTVQLELTDPDVSKVEWYVDGDLQPAGGALFEPSDLMAGSYELTAIVYDEVLSYANSDNASPHLLDRVRQGGDKLKDTLAWNLELTEIFTTSIQGELDRLAASLTVELTGNTLEIVSPLFEKMNHNITLYNNVGRAVSTIYNTKSLDRSGVKRLDISEYPIGIYYLMIQGFKEPIVRKVSIMR